VPCDIGYRTIAETRVVVPKPQTFESRTAAPEIDAELLDRLGQEDPAFLRWAQELDLSPLLAKALERALAALSPRSKVEFAVRSGALAARSTVRGDAEKAKAEADIEAVARRWTVEVLRVIAELLDYQVTLVAARIDGRDVLVIEGEKTRGGDVREFLRITADAKGNAEVRLEHFASEPALSAEEARLLALARRLGVRLTVKQLRRSGKPIPKGAKHSHPQKGKGKA